MSGRAGKSHSARYGAREPLLAGPFRAGLYMVWRSLFAITRPLIFLTLLGGAFVFAYQGLREGPAETLTGSPSLSARLDETVNRAALDTGRPPEQLWQDQLSKALRSGYQQFPNLPLAESSAHALVSVIGRDRLAMDLLSQTRRLELVEAELRALPAWRRDNVLDEVIALRLQDGRRMGLVPEELVLAPQLTRQRYSASQSLYGRAYEDADRWFAAPGGRALDLKAFGLDAEDPDRLSPLYGDVRALVIEGCALAREQGLRVSQCELEYIPQVRADAVRTALALSLYDPDTNLVGGRLAIAAWLAGPSDHSGWRSLALGADPRMGQQRLLTALLPLISEAGAVYAQPQQYQSQAEAVAEEYRRTADLSVTERRTVYQALALVRRLEGAFAAIHTGSLIYSAGDADGLAQLSQVAEGRLLAAHDILGDELASVWRSAPRTTALIDFERVEIQLASALFALAILMLCVVLISGLRRRMGGVPGGYERLDAAVTRLILGRNV